MANEDFTTYTEVDPNSDITVTATQVSWSGLVRSSVSYVYKDFGAGHFNTDFTHQFEFSVDNFSSGLAWVFFCSDQIGTVVGQQGLSGNGVGLLPNGSVGYCAVYESGSQTSAQISKPLTNGTTYYMTVVHDSTQNATIFYFRTGSHSGELFDTVIVVHSGAISYRYMYAVTTHGSGGGTSDGNIQNLNLSGTLQPIVTVYEDFTTYTEVDGGDDITVSANNITFVNMPRSVDSYVWKNHGAAHFGGDFTHQIEFTISSYSAGISGIWAITNDLDDLNGLISGGKTFAIAYVTSASPFGVRLSLYESGSNIGSDITINLSVGTKYYVTIVRDDDEGDANVGLYTAYFRTGSHLGTLVDTIVANANTQLDYSNLLTCQTGNNGNAAQIVSGLIENLNLNEGTTFLVTSIGGVAVENISSIAGVAIENVSQLGGVTIQS